MEEKFAQLVEYGHKVHKTDEDIQPLRRFMEEEIEVAEVIFKCFSALFYFKVCYNLSLTKFL